MDNESTEAVQGIAQVLTHQYLGTTSVAEIKHMITRGLVTARDLAEEIARLEELDTARRCDADWMGWMGWRERAEALRPLHARLEEQAINGTVVAATYNAVSERLDPSRLRSRLLSQYQSWTVTEGEAGALAHLMVEGAAWLAAGMEALAKVETGPYGDDDLDTAQRYVAAAMAALDTVGRTIQNREEVSTE